MTRTALALGLVLAALVVAPASAAALPSRGDSATASVEAKANRKAGRGGRARLKAFRSCAGLVRYGRRYVERGAGAGPPQAGVPVAQPVPPTPPALPGRPGFPAPVAAPAPGAEGTGTSPTNVQEPGVDEPDIVKARGSRIFSVVGARLHAVDARGPRLLGSLALEGSAHELLLYRKRLLVLSREYASAGFPGPAVGPSSLAFPGPGSTLLTEVDVSDPSAMRIVRSARIPGSYLTARLGGASARVVISSPPAALAEPGLRRRLRGFMPSYTLVDRRGKRRVRRRLAACRSVRRPPVFSGLDMLSVLTIDMSKGLPAVDAVSVLAGSGIAYASPDSLFVATQKWTPQPATPGAPPPRAFSTIHKFDVSDADRARYRGSGTVPGYLLNQFSMSERKGVLRVASTEDPLWWQGAPRPESESFVTTLAERDGALRRLGRVGGLGRGERIYAVRFIDDAGFVVTFRQTDPLYTIDLATPRRPRVRGELKVLGYSAYLHPIGKDLLLGVGQDATEDGRRLGTQLSLFDVSNLGRPARLAHRKVGEGSSSSVEFDHHAFLWWAPTKLAVIPVQGFGSGAPVPLSGPAPTGFVGAIGFRVSRGGIAEVGRAAHDAGLYPAEISRSLVAAGRLFTLSYSGVEAEDLATLAERAWLAFPSQ